MHRFVRIAGYMIAAALRGIDQLSVDSAEVIGWLAATAAERRIGVEYEFN